MALDQRAPPAEDTRSLLGRALLLTPAPDGYCLVDQSGEDEGRTQERERREEAFRQ